MNRKPWKICYFRNGYTPTDDGYTFGCSVADIAGFSKSAEWSIRPMGTTLSGTYVEVLTDLQKAISDRFCVDAVIIYFARNAGIEEFLRQISIFLPGVPVGGGVAAYNEDIGCGELLPKAQDVVILLIHDNHWQFTNFWSNMHDNCGSVVNFRAAGPRTILTIREGDIDLPAQQWYSRKRSSLGYRVASYENIALASSDGWNLHASREGEFALHTGADLPRGGELHIRTLSDFDARHRITMFCEKANTLLFGCAGLRSMFGEMIKPGKGSLIGFLHGEILTVKGIPKLANLMMSGMIAEKSMK